MKNQTINKIMLLFLLLILASAFVSASDLVFFSSTGCPFCAKEEIFLESVQEKYPSLNISSFDLRQDKNSIKLLQKFSKVYKNEITHVPITYINNNSFIGFSDEISKNIEDEIKYCEENKCESPFARIQDAKTNIERITIPAVISAAAVDAINPCAFAVLILLLSTILIAKDRKKALLAGLAFSFAVYISYFLMGYGLFTAIKASGITHAFYFIVAVLAVVIGLFNLKDYLWYGKWFRMEVPMSWRPKMKLLIKSVTSVPGAFVVGIIVSLFLLPCTSGPYIVILGLLANAVTRDYAILLLLLYNLIFILPMIIITLAIYFRFTTAEKAEEWKNKRIKQLHLIAGIILLLLGIAMLFANGFGWI